MVPRSPDTQIFDIRYPVTCKVHTGYRGTSETVHGFSACTVDKPLAKARSLSLCKAYKPCYISHLLTTVKYP